MFLHGIDLKSRQLRGLGGAWGTGPLKNNPPARSRQRTNGHGPM
ncbi:hypothetical protein BF49_1085 [Bradyrhizobium sp.]|nr:hypothetical protein BF49_1085 [Bradyrhizobium sp.]